MTVTVRYEVRTTPKGSPLYKSDNFQAAAAYRKEEIARGVKYSPLVVKITEEAKVGGKP